MTTQVDLAGTYHGLAESRVAPLLITGSWVGWLLDILRHQLNPRFSIVRLNPYPDHEALECVYNYAELFNVNLTEESALAIQAISRNHPWYISTIIRSLCPNKDLSTVEGVEAVLHHEVNNKDAEINGHWTEYLNYAFERTNGKRARAIILFLSSDRYQEKTRTEIQAYLKRKGLDLDDRDLEQKLKLLTNSDIIEEGSTAFHYKGVQDDIFDQVVQVLYAFEIESIKLEETHLKIHQGNQKKISSIDTGLFQQNKGIFLEFMMIRYLKYRTLKRNTVLLKELIQNAPESAVFTTYRTVGEQHFNLSDGYHRQFDVVARAADDLQPSLLIECKYHEKPVGSSDIEHFAEIADDLKYEIQNLIPILYSVSGFTDPAKKKMKELNISWSTPEFWQVL